MQDFDMSLLIQPDDPRYLEPDADDIWVRFPPPCPPEQLDLVDIATQIVQRRSAIKQGSGYREDGSKMTPEELTNAMMAEIWAAQMLRAPVNIGCFYQGDEGRDFAVAIDRHLPVNGQLKPITLAYTVEVIWGQDPLLILDYTRPHRYQRSEIIILVNGRYSKFLDGASYEFVGWQFKHNVFEVRPGGLSYKFNFGYGDRSCTKQENLWAMSELTSYFSKKLTHYDATYRCCDLSKPGRKFVF